MLTACSNMRCLLAGTEFHLARHPNRKTRFDSLSKKRDQILGSLLFPASCRQKAENRSVGSLSEERDTNKDTHPNASFFALCVYTQLPPFQIENTQISGAAIRKLSEAPSRPTIFRFPVCADSRTVWAPAPRPDKRTQALCFFPVANVPKKQRASRAHILHVLFYPVVPQVSDPFSSLQIYNSCQS